MLQVEAQLFLYYMQSFRLPPFSWAPPPNQRYFRTFKFYFIPLAHMEKDVKTLNFTFFSCVSLIFLVWMCVSLSAFKWCGIFKKKLLPNLWLLHFSFFLSLTYLRESILRSSCCQIFDIRIFFLVSHLFKWGGIFYQFLEKAQTFEKKNRKQFTCIFDQLKPQI